MRGGRLGAYPVYLTMRGASALLYATVFTLSAVYRVEVAHLGPLELTLVGTALESAVFLGEVPTGVVADVYSRRLSIVIGLALVGAGFMLEGTLPIFATILLAQVLWGVGYTFTSGADSAWIADELGEERATEVFLRGAQASHVGALLGIGLSVLLGSVRLNLPLLAAGALFWALAAFLALAMPERHFTPAPREGRETRRAMAATLRGGAREVRRRPVLVTLLATGAIYGMASEGFDRLYAIHFLRDLRLPALDGLTTVGWFGIINAAAMLLSLLAAEVARRRVDATTSRGAAGALLAINALLAAAVVAFGLAGSFALALGAYLTAYLLRETNDPIYAAWVNQGLPSRVRATVISMSSQANAFGQIAGGPLLGAIGSLVSVRAAIVAAGAALSPSLLLYLRALARGETPLGVEAEALPSSPAVALDEGRE